MFGLDFSGRGVGTEILQVYFRGLVGEGERRRRENIALGVGVGGGVRLVEEGGKE